MKKILYALVPLASLLALNTCAMASEPTEQKANATLAPLRQKKSVRINEEINKIVIFNKELEDTAAQALDNQHQLFGKLKTTLHSLINKAQMLNQLGKKASKEELEERIWLFYNAITHLESLCFTRDALVFTKFYDQMRTSYTGLNGLDVNSNTYNQRSENLCNQSRFNMDFLYNKLESLCSLSHIGLQKYKLQTMLELIGQTKDPHISLFIKALKITQSMLNPVQTRLFKRFATEMNATIIMAQKLPRLECDGVKLAYQRQAKRCFENIVIFSTMILHENQTPAPNQQAASAQQK